MRAAQIRTIIIALPDLVEVHAALVLLNKGKGLTALQSGVVAEAAITNLEMVEIADPFFDGFNYVQFVYVATG